MEKEQISLKLLDLITLKEYYDKKWKAGSSNTGCRTQESLNAEKISKECEKQIDNISTIILAK